MNRNSWLGRILFMLCFLAFGALKVCAQTNGTDIATGAEDAFAIVAPIVVTIATFFVVVRIAKRVTR